MSEPNHKFYLTTPIYYVNARPHIGHAYTTIAADVIARRHRLLGDDTFFLTGTDEHGQKIQRSAEAAGIPPQQFADEVSDSFRNLWKRMGITNDDYIRTTEPRHKAGVQKLFRTLQQNGYIELRSYTGQYCISDETFVDVPVGAPCPECGRITETVTEENYFFKLSAFQRQLIDLIESGELAIQPETRRNEVLSFLRGNVASAQTSSDAVILSEAPERAAGESNGAESKDPVDAGGSQTVQPISATYIAHSDKGNPYVPGALKDLSISRTSFKWGIPVPGDEKHVIYVWLDALANYMTAIGYGSDKPEDQKRFEKYWPADLHLVGKEIIRFHCVYWPAFLLAAKLPLPKAITAHGWLLFENDKMSKSKGNIVRTETILDAFGTLLPYPAEANSVVKGTASAVPQETAKDAALAAEVHPSTTDWKHEQDLFSADVLRYFLLREIPFGNDGSFSFDALVQRYNSDLANGYGNLVSRTLNLIYQNQEGAVIKTERPWLCESKKSFPRIGKIEAQKDDFQEDDFSDTETIIGKISQLIDGSKNINDSRLGNLTSVISLRIRFVDAYLTANAPWKLAKSSEPSDRQRMDEVLYTAAESIRILTALIYPILPYATSKVWAQLGLGDIEEAARRGELNNLKWGGLKPGTKLGPLGPIFPRAPKELIQLMNDIETANAPKSNGSNGSKSVVALPQVNSDLDASTRHRSEFAEMPIASASATPALNKVAETVHPIASHHPAEARAETPQIAIDDFIKIDLRVAQIVAAERIPKADKLLRLEVDLGYERRQILSGIAQWYTPEELIGRRIVVIANLAPRKMRGLESHGMLLAASKGEDDKPVLATFGEEIALGSRLK